MQRSSKKNRIYLIIGIILVVLIITLIILLASLKKYKEHENIVNKVHTYTDTKDFETIEEVATYLDCKYIRNESSKVDEFTYDVYMKIKYEPYTNNQSNKLFYDRLISYSARVFQYKSFRIIDKEQNITIDVICNEESQKIKKKIINGKEDYFSKYDSLIEINNISKTVEINMDIQSKEIKKLIEKNWYILSSELGTKESIFNKYDIYFDEGIEIRNIDNKVFNIIFTKNYKEEIVNGIKTSSTKEEIIKQIGQPNFEDKQYGIIGYKGKDIYIFFNDRQEVSIYRVEKNDDSTEFARYVEEYLEDKDEDKLISNIKNKYQDFDKYKNDENGAILAYSIKGIEIKFQKNSGKGIYIYNNYIGTIYKNINLENLIENKNLPDNIYVKNENLVYRNEVIRLAEMTNLEEIAVTNTVNSNVNQSTKFWVIEENDDGENKKIGFISIDRKNPNCELKEYIDYYLWIDDYNFIYSKKK